MSARQALEVATLGGAAVLGRDDIGSIAPGMAADLVGFRTDTLPMTGTHSDPVAGLLFGAPHGADLSIINGRIVIEDGELAGVEMPVLIERHTRLSRGLFNS
jgi:cytosine/adenosine deaminase-related metal-dependent hydrolase